MWNLLLICQLIKKHHFFKNSIVVELVFWTFTIQSQEPCIFKTKSQKFLAPSHRLLLKTILFHEKPYHCKFSAAHVEYSFKKTSNNYFTKIRMSFRSESKHINKNFAIFTTRMFPQKFLGTIEWSCHKPADNCSPRIQNFWIKLQLIKF